MDSITIQEIAGPNMTIFESYYADVNPDNTEIIKAYEAANFLRMSGLNQLTLKNIWDLSDPNCLGHLDKKSFFISLKLTAMVQNGRMLNMNDLKIPLPPPIFGDNVLNTLDWSIPAETIEKAQATFKSLNPIDGKLTGSKVKPHMIKSNLPVDILTKVWDLSDIDKDGFLDEKEFIISCHLISKTVQGLLLPEQLPGVLVNFEPVQKVSPTSSLPAFVAPQKIISPTHQLPSPQQQKQTFEPEWVISAAEKTLYDQAFAALDHDNDGFVCGADVKGTLLQSGLQQNVLAHIWNLCDISGSGYLNPEQFALANYLIKLKQNGKDLPPHLTPEMVPPSARLKQTSRPSSVTSPVEEKSTTNKEFDIFEGEIKQLQAEKIRLESDVNDGEGSLRLKQAELKTIENEIESLTIMLKQLETQKNDATRRLDDLNSQFIEFEARLQTIVQRFNDETLKVQTLNVQYLDEKKKIDEQNIDVVSKRQEFDSLKSEEIKLESKLTLTKTDAEQVAKNVTDTQLEISQLKSKSVELEEYERRINDMISDYDQSIRNNDVIRIASLLPRSITPPLFLDADATLDDIKADFADPFAGDDPFKDNPSSGGWQANFDAFSADPFPSNANDPFRTESPTPALPPKKSKPPPPRPAPPKATVGSSIGTGINKTPLRAAPPPPSKGEDNFDPFGNSNSSSANDNHDPFVASSTFNTNNQQNFANFANFD